MSEPQGEGWRVRRSGADWQGSRPCGVNNRFPALTAVIDAHLNTIAIEGQACQFLDRMLTDWWRVFLLPPLRLEISCLSFRHASRPPA